ncbi:protein strawberry notch isoform X2 [Frankliniella occidentalis]|uniref:Protein strawberry notch isoform X2 n=1 Tax=Frankliniella occidentalis TaxID=133901 RepID=A0A6J1SJC5_FRAOC|nr:protein strawberry notch isoform X2 [Frankliniella occidentalis]
MPRTKRTVSSKKKAIKEEMSDSPSDSDSDFDEDEDPDKIEVPGGGKDLVTAVTTVSAHKDGPVVVKKEDPDVHIVSSTSVPSNAIVPKLGSSSTLPVVKGGTSLLKSENISPLMGNPNEMKTIKREVPLKMGNFTNVPGAKVPGGLITKGTSLGFETMRSGGPNIPSFSPNVMNNFIPGMLSGVAGNASANLAAGNMSGMLNHPFLQSNMMGMDMSNVNAPFATMMAHMMTNPNMSTNPYMSQFMGPMMQGNWNPALQGKNMMWMNDQKMAAGEEEEVEDEDMGVAETYADYMPTKLKLGKKHPDPVVETASLSSVEPADVWYKLSLPDSTVKSGSLSALQLEAIVYASQQHEHFLPDGNRAGFLIGDGAGVGKGRTIAGVIYENHLKGRKKAIWVSVSNDLKYDSERDLKDIGAGQIDVHPLNKFKYAKISSSVNGNVKEGVIFSTYSALIGESSQTSGKYKSRLKQLIDWCGDNFDGCIIFDECHRAKNLCPVGSSKPTKTGLTVLEIQNQLPKARVVYASATGASEPRNMAYMTRLGIWGEGTAFKDFNEYINAVEKRGVGAMEIVAMDMKLRGMYIARQLSFHGVSFKIEEVHLSDDFIKIYDDSVKLWVRAMQKFTEAAELIDAESRMKKTMWGQFWSAHQRFFKYLCIAAKVKFAVSVAREAVKCGKCVVIGLQSTGEARTLEQIERDDGELSDFVSTAKGVLQTLVEKHFPAPDRSRILRLLGLSPPRKDKKSKKSDDDDEEAGGSSGKRKPVRRAAQRASKRVKVESSDSGSDNESGSDAEFQLSASESAASESNSEASDASSDFNPFNDSDSDGDPWVGGRGKKKGRKGKAAAKKPSSTQDKISLLIEQKSSAHKKAKREEGNKNGNSLGAGLPPPPRDAIEHACNMKEELLADIEELGDRLPPNTLDQLIDELGGPENVAEMTGRKGRVVQTDGGIQYESRSEVDVPLETLNLTEKQRFMDGEKDVAIISEAASSGISLQSDRRARNQRRRVHITLELPWSADRAIQQFGRTHRSNQVNAPEYLFLISDLAGERRFASIVAKRLESLGALTHGDRRATETRDLSRFNIDNKYGRQALEATMKAIMGYEQPRVPPPQDYKGDFFKDVADALVGVGLITNSENMPGILMLDKDYNNMSKFLNRILGMPVDLQNRLFKYFTDTLQAIISDAKKTGRFDLGILDLGASGENVKRIKVYTFLRKHATGTAATQLHIVHVERGMSWSDVTEKYQELVGAKEGFYLSHQIRNSKQTAILAVAVESNPNNKKKGTKEKDTLYAVYRPNTGLQLKQETLGELEKKYKKVSKDEAEPHWTQQYDSSEKTCSHAYWRGNCKNVALGMDCEIGLRRRTYNVLAGCVLSVWTKVEDLLNSRTGHNSKMQVVRMRASDGLKIVGTLIPNSCVEDLIEALQEDSEKMEEEKF